jgi:nitrogen fixation NifU-like protein
MADDIDKIAQTLQEAIFKGYSEKFKQEFSNPKNIGKIEDADSQVSITGVCGDTIEMYLVIKNQRIDDIKFVTNGCGATIACTSYIARAVKGKTIKEAIKMKTEDVDSYFEGLPQESKHCAKLAIDTLKAVLNRYEIKEQKPKIASEKMKKKSSNEETTIS